MSIAAEGGRRCEHREGHSKVGRKDSIWGRRAGTLSSHMTDEADQRAECSLTAGAFREGLENCLKKLRVEQNASERFRILSKNLANETAEQTDIAQADSKRHLENRVIDIHVGLSELEWESRLNVEEWQKLDRQKRSLEKLLEKTDFQAQIAQECLYYREKRQEIDLVHDVAEKSLLAELDTVRWCQEGLRQLIKRAENELWSLREAKHVLEKDMADKLSAQEIDLQAAELKNPSPQLGSYSATELVDTCCTVPLTWKEFTSKNCEESKKCRQVSTKLREETTCYMRTAVNALASGWAEASAALSARIREVTTARCEIVESLEKVMTEISEVEENIAMLKKCIAEKEAPRRVAETRLSLRLNRTGYENCRDSAYTRLVEELPEIRETADSLQSALRKSEKTLQSLFSFKRLLECDLQRKLNSIFIDNEKCLGLRRLCPSIT
ncbi:Tektin [Sparganum proliferum]